MQLLVAPAAFTGTLRATEVAAAIGQGIEAAGLAPPDLCPLAGGGEGTIEILLGRLGGETAAARVSGRAGLVGFALLEDGSTALVEAAAASPRGPAGTATHGTGTRGAGTQGAGTQGAGTQGAGTQGTGELILAAIEAGARVVVVAAGGPIAIDGGVGAIGAIAAGGGLRGASLVVLCDVRRPITEPLAQHAGLPRDPRGVAYGGSGGGLAGGLWAAYGAQLRPGAQFVLDALDFDTRMRAARAVIVGEGRLDRSSLDGKPSGEAATRARQAGVPAHAIVGVDELDRFDARILDLQEILTAASRPELVAAGAALARLLERDVAPRSGRRRGGRPDPIVSDDG